MQVLEFPKIDRIKSYNSLECSCQKINLGGSKKKIVVCELCSEKKFLRQNSSKFSYDDTSSTSFTNSE